MLHCALCSMEINAFDTDVLCALKSPGEMSSDPSLHRCHVRAGLPRVSWLGSDDKTQTRLLTQPLSLYTVREDSGPISASRHLPARHYHPIRPPSPCQVTVSPTGHRDPNRPPSPHQAAISLTGHRDPDRSPSPRQVTVTPTGRYLPVRLLSPRQAVDSRQFAAPLCTLP